MRGQGREHGGGEPVRAVQLADGDRRVDLVSDRVQPPPLLFVTGSAGVPGRRELVAVEVADREGGFDLPAGSTNTVANVLPVIGL